MDDRRGFFEALVGDGRPLVSLTGVCLLLSGGFVIFQSVTGQFLPQDTAFLGMSAQELCKVNECRVVHFMIHDRVSFGGALVAIGALYLWMSEFPLRAGERWAWWTLAASGVTGFGSFLAYLGYGYLDTWHGAATLVLLPCFAGGLVRIRRRMAHVGPVAPPPVQRKGMGALGRWCLLATAAGMFAAGLTIHVIGMTSVFVATDLAFMGLSRQHLDAISPRLVPLIAHDRAGFGGAVATAGLLTFGVVRWGTPSRSLWQVLLVGGLAGFGAAVGVHPVIGYTDSLHLAPAVAGAALYLLGLALSYGIMHERVTSSAGSVVEEK